MKITFSKALLFIIAIFFIVSAVSKLFPVIQFEFLLGSFAIPWGWTPYVARTVISIELILGLLLLFRFRLVQISIPLCIRFLLFMILVLMYRWYTAGADAECGCMGEWLSMTPAQSIVKNIVLIVALLWLKRTVVQRELSRKWNYLLGVLLLGALVAPYVVEPVYIGVNTAWTQQESYPMDIDLLYAENQKETPKVNLREGKHIVAFLSINCPHCKLAAEKLGIIDRQNSDYPIYLLINGDDEEISKFRKEHKCESVQFSKLLQPQFLQLSGPSLPSVQFVDNGMVIRNVDYLDLDNESIRKFLD